VKHDKEEIFYLVSSKRLSNFSLEGVEKQMDVDLSDEESPTNGHQSEDFLIPFWLMMKIEERSDSLYLDCIFHLPHYRTHEGLNNQIVKEELKRLVELISQRIKVIILMKQLNETREMPHNLALYHTPIEQATTLTKEESKQSS